MPMNDHLVPVSFHLRNFNKYTKLDLAASQNGNLTLIGENAVGKTTLANCFYPMLIDGSIATPSFNAAKGTDKLDRTGKPRNSAQDARNFDSMLLGWGAGAMKIRTGYSYMTLRSKRRQVILGIGAQRTVGSTSQATWWFLVASTDLSQPLTVTTTDENGKSLSRAEFVAANQDLGTTLTVFDSATSYRDQVATQVYGFDDGATLSKLAAAYRLLASPILTAGNAKFTPIISALKNAQAGIDLPTISDIAESQRDVNYTNGLLDRLNSAETRLKRIKEAIFWRNLNHLEELNLNAYTDNQAHLEQQVAVRDDAQQVIDDCEHQLKLITADLQETAEYLTELRVAQAKQKVIKQTRDQLSKEIADVERRIQLYQQQVTQLEQLRQQATEIQAEQQRLTTQIKTVTDMQLSPLRAKLAQHTANLAELRQVVTETELPDLADGLQRYIQHQRLYQTKYQGLEGQIKQGNRNVQIVSEMKTTLDGCIDQRVQGPLSGRMRDGLHLDNQTVHDDGASEMDQMVKELIKERNQLLVDHPDIKVFLAQPNLLTTLTKLRQDLAKLLKTLAQLHQQATDTAQHAEYKQKEINQVQSSMEPNFDVEAQTAAVQQLKTQREALIIDPNLDNEYKVTDASYKKLQLTERHLNSKKDKKQGSRDAANRTIADYQARVDELGAQIGDALQTLRPYMPVDNVLTDADEVLDFVHANHATVKNANYTTLVDYIGKQIHHNDVDGVDLNALDTIFEERGHGAETSQMRQQRTVNEHGMTIVAFDINHAQALIKTDQANVQKKLDQLEAGNDAAQAAYVAAAVERIDRQYRLIDEYNQMLNQGAKQAESIKLKITLTPAEVSDMVIAEARNPRDEKRVALTAEVRRRLNKLANDLDVAGDEDAFMAEAATLLDTRQWSEFKVFIKRRQNQEDEYEEVNDKFVQSGGSGAEKAQAMVLPLLLVPKMVLNQSSVSDAPYLVMFDEFADKLDPETAKSFARTIANFGFNFIATMPSGAQNKILADGVDNIAYDVIAPKNQQPGKFYKNMVRPALIWQKEVAHEQLS